MVLSTENFAPNHSPLLFCLVALACVSVVWRETSDATLFKMPSCPPTHAYNSTAGWRVAITRRALFALLINLFFLKEQLYYF